VLGRIGGAECRDDRRELGGVESRSREISEETWRRGRRGGCGEKGESKLGQ